MEKNTKTTNTKEKLQKYHIFRVEKIDDGNRIFDREKLITMKVFTAKDDQEAYNVLKEFRRIANKEYAYYYGEYMNHVALDEKGEKHYFNSMDELMSDYSINHTGFIHRIKMWLDTRIVMPFNDLRFWFEKMNYFRKTGHSISERWSLFDHMLDDIEHNIPILMDTITVPAYYEVLAYKKTHGDDSKTEFFDSPSRRIYEGNEKEYKIAKELWNEALTSFLRDVMLYRFYDNYGIIDESDEKYVKLREDYAKTIPYKPGRYKTVDFHRLDVLKTKQKNRIFDFLRKYVTTLGD